MARPRKSDPPSPLGDWTHRPRGARLSQNQVKLRRQQSNGQYSITIPSGVARALYCEGGEVFEVFIEQDAIVLRRRTS